MPRNKTKEDANLQETTVKSTCTVRKTFTNRGQIISEEDSGETIEVHKFITTPAEVGVQFGSTINLGNFNAARIDIWCKVPAYVEEMGQAYEFAKTFADDRMREEIETLDKRPNKAKETHNMF